MIDLQEIGDGFVASLILNDLRGGNGYGGGGGGGGGGGKSKAQKLLERIKREEALSDHRLKMLNYTEQFYEGKGELTNVNSLLLTENDLRTDMIEEYKKHIEELYEELGKTEKESDDWYSLRDAILATEEKIEESTNAIEENTRKYRENVQAILK